MLPLKHIHHRKTHHSPVKGHHRLLDHTIYFIAFAGPVMTVPQIYDIWVTRNPSVNTITWSSYLLFGIVWLYYGIIHKQKPIIFSNILGIITTGLVVLGTVIYS